MLLVVGIGVFVAGLVAAAFGLPVKEFSFGNTLILSGAVVSCTGLIMISLSLVVRELQAATDRLYSETAAADRGVSFPASIPPGRGVGDSFPPWDADQGALNAASGPAGTPSARSARWQADMPRDRVAVGAVPDIAVPEFPVPPGTTSSPKPRRNFLFASSMREERERVEPSAPGGLSPPATRAPEPEASRVSSDDARARPERSRPEPGSAPPASASAGDRGAGSAGLHGQTSSAVSVLRSGVVDGMAYSLYSDGTIEAQLPEGMMRFASIDRLRAHLDLGSDRPSRV